MPPSLLSDTDAQSPIAPPLTHSIQFNVFSKMVESDEDFLGLLAYSLYKRHKIEWIRDHDSSNHDPFKRIACTEQQVRMYRD